MRSAFKILIAALLLTVTAKAQYVQPMGYSDYSFPHRVNIGNSVVKATHPSAHLEIGPATGSTRGFLPPRLTTTERNAIPSPAAWLVIFNVTTQRWNYYDTTGTDAWKEFTVADIVGWRMSGNDLTASPVTVKLGTISPDPLSFYTNNLKRIYIPTYGIARDDTSTSTVMQVLDTVTNRWAYKTIPTGSDNSVYVDGLEKNNDTVRLSIPPIQYNGKVVDDLGASPKSLIWQYVGNTDLGSGIWPDGGFSFPGRGDTIWWKSGWKFGEPGNGGDSIFFSPDKGVTWQKHPTLIFPFHCANFSGVKARVYGDWNVIAYQDFVVRFKDPYDFQVMTSSAEYGERYNFFICRDQFNRLFAGGGTKDRCDSSAGVNGRQRDIWMSKDYGATWTLMMDSIAWMGSDQINRVQNFNYDWLYFIDANNRVITTCPGYYGVSGETYKIRIEDVLSGNMNGFVRLDDDPIPRTFSPVIEYRGMLWNVGGGRDQFANTNAATYLDKNDEWHIFPEYLGIDSLTSGTFEPPHATDLLVLGGSMYRFFGAATQTVYRLVDTAALTGHTVRDYLAIGPQKFTYTLDKGYFVNGFGVEAGKTAIDQIKRTRSGASPFSLFTEGKQIFGALSDDNSTINVDRSITDSLNVFEILSSNQQVIVSNPYTAWDNLTNPRFQGYGRFNWTGKARADTFFVDGGDGFYQAGVMTFMSEVDSTNTAWFGRAIHPSTTNGRVVKVSADGGSAVSLRLGEVRLHYNMFGGAGSEWLEDDRIGYKLDVNGNWVPGSDNNFDLGTSSVQVRKGYFKDTLFNIGNTYKTGPSLVMSVLDTVTGAYHHQAIPVGGTAYVDSIWRVAGIDSFYWRMNGVTGAIKDSVGGGGSGTPAGNFGNLQINRNGAFATPASDSLDWESATGLSVKGFINVTVTGAGVGNGDIQVTNSGGTAATLRLNNTATNGRDYWWFSTSTTLDDNPAGSMALYDGTANKYPFGFKYGDVGTAKVVGNNTYASSIFLKSVAAGGSDWYMMSTANDAALAGAWSIYQGSSGQHALWVNASREVIVGTGTDNGSQIFQVNGTSYFSGVSTFNSDLIIPDEAYDATNFDGVLEPVTKNAFRDKLEAFVPKGWEQWNLGTIQTSNATVTTCATITCPADGHGILIVYLVGTKSDNSKAISGQKIVHWKSVSGTVTVNQVTDIEADYLDGFSTATWTVDANSGNLRVRVTGEAGTTVDWSASYKLKYNSY